jgi:hypothetical protein
MSAERASFNENSYKESTSADLEGVTHENGSDLLEGGVSSGAAVPRQVSMSRMEKDPLNVGVPFPVLIVSRCPSPACTYINAEAAVVDEGDVNAVDVVEGTLEPDTRGVAVGLDYAWGVAVGLDYEAGILASNDGQILSSATLPMRKSTEHNNTVPVPVHVETSDANVAEATEHSLMRAVSILSQQVGATVPGGYAVPGPAAGRFQAAEDEEASLGEGVFCHDTSTQPTTSTQRDESDFLVEATLVSDQHDQTIIHAQPLPLRRFPFVATTALALTIALIAIVVLATVRKDTFNASTNQDSPSQAAVTSSPTNAPLPTLERIRKAGILKCGGGTLLIALFAHLDSVAQPSNASSEPRKSAEAMARNFSVGFVSSITRLCPKVTRWIPFPVHFSNSGRTVLGHCCSCAGQRLCF